MKPAWVFGCAFTTFSLLWMAHAESDETEKDAVATTDSIVGKTPGQVRDDNGLTMKFVWCPPGFLKMKQVELIFDPAAENAEGDPTDEHVGRNDDEPIDDEVIREEEVEISATVTPVKVFLTRGYWLGKFEVTQSEWKQVMQIEPWKGQENTKEGSDFPATNVSWNDASDFCRKLTEQERQAGRLSNEWEYTLPTEAQWERACRARTETEFSFGDDESKLGDYAWFYVNAWNAGEKYAHRVGQKKPNSWGLCDMHGNVCEWCRDVYVEKLLGGRDPEVKADEKSKGSDRVLRGGCWAYSAAVCQSGDRSRYRPGKRSCGYGFRVALSPLR